MRAREFEKLLALLDPKPWTASEIDQRTRGLRDAGLLPVGGRGLNAPHITAQHAALILISLAATNSAVETVEAVPAYASMEAVGPDTLFSGQVMFADALGGILADRYGMMEILEVFICRTWPEAKIKYQRGGRERKTVYRPPGSPKIKSVNRVGVGVTLGGGILQQLALDLAVNDTRWLSMVKQPDQENEH